MQVPCIACAEVQFQLRCRQLSVAWLRLRIQQWLQDRTGQEGRTLAGPNEYPLCTGKPRGASESATVGAIVAVVVAV